MKSKRINDKNILIEKLVEMSPSVFKDKITNAIEFSSYIHENHKRFSGEDYIIHNLNVALNCARLKLDTASIITAILHQSISERLFTKDEINVIQNEIKAEFTEEISQLIKDVEVINNATKENKEVNVNTLKRYLLSTTKDIRPLIIKTMDVLDDLRTAQYIPSHKIKQFSKKVLDVYGPISEYLNLSEIKKEIEEEAFRYLDEDMYKLVSQRLEAEKINERLKDKYIKYLELITDIIGYKPKIIGRVKGKYSIFLKLHKYFKEGKGDKIDRIKDILAFSIITQNIQDCYTITNAIKTLTKEDIEMFDDYITFPKPNGYSAIQMTVQIPEISNVYIEIQVLTYEMYQYNTYGPASHIAYKASKSRFAKNSESMDWVEEIHEKIKKHIQEREDRLSIPINGNIFTQRVFAFTPKGLIIELEQGSTALDFAYRIHTSIGDHAISSIINKKPGKLSQILNTGDVVEIIIDHNRKKHTPDTLNWIKSEFAKKRIKKNLLKYR